MSGLAFENVVKTYKTAAGRELPALRGISFQAEAGQRVAIVGRSGSGKSTLLHLAAGIDVATSGRVLFDGKDLARLSDRDRTLLRRGQVGLVFQFYNLLPVLSAARNVELPLLLTHLSKAQRMKHVETALGVVGLSHRMKHLPRELSGGEQQRVGIARGIVTDPTLILCDEPTGDLDRKSGDEVLDLLKALNRDHKKTVVMVTHDPHAAARASRTLYLNEGKLGTEPVE